MRLAIAAAVVAAVALAACSRQESATGPGAAGPDGFPALNASYSAHYQMLDPSTGAVSSEGDMYRDGAQRMRFDMDRDGRPMAIIFDAPNRRSLMFRTDPDAPHTALVMPHGETSFFDDMGRWDAWASDDGARPEKTGSDTVAGESCDVWRSPSEESGEASEACITRDGVLLRTGQVGAAHPDMIATSVSRARPDAALFALPAGYETIDYGPCMAMMSEVMAAAKAGQRPDMARMQECQRIGERASALMGD